MSLVQYVLCFVISPVFYIIEQRVCSTVINVNVPPYHRFKIPVNRNMSRARETLDTRAKETLEIGSRINIKRSDGE